ncbi:hypothetical protein Fmac_000429 [Flemingia macrophylla]|uniref:Uncharacterized protein n=1 Tax=Flemingia macrophylla TaxID=520843 RepID=A0ABD1NE88_9FABA
MSYVMNHEWIPEPLISPLSKEMQNEPSLLLERVLIVFRCDWTATHTIVNGTSANYLGLIGHPKLFESGYSAIEKYGVDSCAPRGFYIWNNRDEGVHWGIQNGLYLSRSTVMYFKHHELNFLRETLEKITTEIKETKKSRRCIVVEAVYQAEVEWARFEKGGMANRPPLASAAVISAAITGAISILEENPNLITKLKYNIALLWKAHSEGDLLKASESLKRVATLVLGCHN